MHSPVPVCNKSRPVSGNLRSTPAFSSSARISLFNSTDTFAHQSPNSQLARLPRDGAECPPAPLLRLRKSAPPPKSPTKRRISSTSAWGQPEPPCQSPKQTFPRITLCNTQVSFYSLLLPYTAPVEHYSSRGHLRHIHATTLNPRVSSSPDSLRARATRICSTLPPLASCPPLQLNRSRVPVRS